MTPHDTSVHMYSTQHTFCHFTTEFRSSEIQARISFGVGCGYEPIDIFSVNWSRTDALFPVKSSPTTTIVIQESRFSRFVSKCSALRLSIAQKAMRGFAVQIRVDCKGMPKFVR